MYGMPCLLLNRLNIQVIYKQSSSNWNGKNAGQDDDDATFQRKDISDQTVAKLSVNNTVACLQFHD